VAPADEVYAICLGEKARVLPALRACSYKFYVRCIRTWLVSHYPTRRDSVLSGTGAPKADTGRSLHMTFL
jgi:hypothetical protein